MSGYNPRMVFNWFRKKKTPAPAPAPRVSTVESPCNGVCEMDWQNNICKSCYRTPNEIGGWDSMDDETRKSIVAAAEERRPS
jgi:predicted Fe-S protein YdhL (DUF1289 family)